jgi:hypothetical protein
VFDQVALHGRGDDLQGRVRPPFRTQQALGQGDASVGGDGRVDQGHAQCPVGVQEVSDLEELRTGLCAEGRGVSCSAQGAVQ